MNKLDRGGMVAFLVLVLREDLERACDYVTGLEQGYYWLYWGWIQQHLGMRRHGLKLTEQALEFAQSQQDTSLYLRTLNNMAVVYQKIGQPNRALELSEQALPLSRAGGDRVGEATTLNNMATVYQATGRPSRALELFEQALPLMRAEGNQAGEAMTLHNMAAVYQTTGQPKRALELFEQVLPLRRAVDDRAGEVITLNAMAGVYQATGQPNRALELYEQVLPLRQALGDRAGEATTLHNMAVVYQTIGQPKRALELFEQTLPLMRAVDDRAGEAATLTNMAVVYQATGQPNRALELYEQALPLMRAVGNQAGEATTLHNMAVVYKATEQPNRALELYEEALSLTRAADDRAGETAILISLAYLFTDMQRYEEALAAFEQSIQLARSIHHPAYEVAALVGVAQMLYQHLSRPEEAITQMEQAIAMLQATGLPQDAAGHTAKALQRILQIMHAGKPLGGKGDSSPTLPADEIQQIVANTIAVMTTRPDHRAKWRGGVKQALQYMQQGGANRQIEADFFTAVLAILDGKAPALPPNHPYVQSVISIQSGIAVGGPSRISISEEILQAVREFVNVKDWKMSRQVVEAKQALLFQPEVEALLEQDIEQAKANGDKRVIRLLEQYLAVLRDCKHRGIAHAFERLAARQEDALPFDVELIPRSIAALLGSPQEKMAHVQYLITLSTSTVNEELKTLINTIQLALFGSDLSRLGQNLSGIYRQAWEAIVVGVETEGVDPRLFDMVVRNTVAVLGPNREQRNQWRESLIQMKGQARAQGVEQLVALLEAISGLLETQGDPAGLGSGLKGIYARTWQSIVAHLPEQQ